jgi:acyl-CoA reductase-like NAD-dependent aldehyde dehydrogenase
MASVSTSRPAASADAETFLAAPHRPFIAGAFEDARTDETIAVENPAREEIVAHVQASGAEDLDRAVAAARTAFERWRPGRT